MERSITGSRLCLTMIVRNEARVIRRCLESVRPYITHWAIVDTGSDDDTPRIVREYLGATPGQLQHRPWRGFSSSRNEALELARSVLGERDPPAGYLLVLDADERWVCPPSVSLPPLVADVYRVLHRIRGGSTRFWLGSIVRASLECRYHGDLHEALAWPPDAREERLPGMEIHGFFDGARNRNPLGKYMNDVAVLERARARDPLDARIAFYLAQSYRDAGNLERSIACYRQRVALGGWPEEIWYSLYQIGELLDRLGRLDEAVHAHLEALAHRPSRAEALVALAALRRRQKRWADAASFATRALRLPVPDDILFLDEAAYTWRPLYEYASASARLGDHQESLRALEQLLNHPSLPAALRPRVAASRERCRDRTSASSPYAGTGSFDGARRSAPYDPGLMP